MIPTTQNRFYRMQRIPTLPFASPPPRSRPATAAVLKNLAKIWPGVLSFPEGRPESGLARDRQGSSRHGMTSGTDAALPAHHDRRALRGAEERSSLLEGCTAMSQEARCWSRELSQALCMLAAVGKDGIQRQHCTLKCPRPIKERWIIER